MPTEKKEKKIVQLEKTESDVNVGQDEHGKIVQMPRNEDMKKKAKQNRILAIVLWIVAIAFEVCGILYLTNVIHLPGLSKMVWLLFFIVLDLIAFVPAALLWKKANHEDPISEKNKVEFFIWNQLGLIMSVIAFAPFVVFVLMNKDLDKKTKGIVSVVAVIAMAVAGFSGYDPNPVSKEALERATLEAEASCINRDEDGKCLVYWAPTSEKYHVTADCPSFSQSETVYEGTVAQAFDNKLSDPCRRCIHEVKDKEEVEK